MGHNPENEIDFEGSGRCPVCRTYSDELLFHACSCCSGAVASCVNDECGGIITRARELPRSSGGRRRLDETIRAQRRDRMIAAGRGARDVL